MQCSNKDTYCHKNFSQSHKFYLSFENSICDDYVTEKFFEPMRHGVIPIVMGAANYSLYAPPHSFINVFDFKGPQELARYLKYLDENDDAYNAYFWWTNYYGLIEYNPQVISIGCQLCEYLNRPNHHQTIPDLKKWWTVENKCYGKWNQYINITKH